ncbi:hypothetical protein L2E82_24655 [Cichorium intybus]|uniref:Uncharacterized protein n=1 Tax=Cichorium intybus TaxID=13427 RepID=A0ACB9E1Q6_CICIN|nr:hypothetical protein L2E82_24655 [Cichorium intybus]
MILLFGFLPSLGRSLIFVGIGPPGSRIFRFERMESPKFDCKMIWLQQSPSFCLHLIERDSNTKLPEGPWSANGAVVDPKNLPRGHHLCFSVSDFDSFVKTLKRWWLKTTRYLGFCLLRGESWHGPVTAVTVASEFCTQQLAKKLMNLLEDISDKMASPYQVLMRDHSWTSFVSLQQPWIPWRYSVNTNSILKCTRYLEKDREMEVAHSEAVAAGETEDNYMSLMEGEMHQFHMALLHQTLYYRRQTGQETDFILVSCTCSEIESSRRESVLRAKKVIKVLKLIVKHLKLLGSQGWSLMREGEAEKQEWKQTLIGSLVVAAFGAVQPFYVVKTINSLMDEDDILVKTLEEMERWKSEIGDKGVDDCPTGALRRTRVPVV